MNRLNKTVSAVINLILAFGFVLFFGLETSPLWDGLTAGGDSAMFVLVGRGITEGVLPYQELLENKGPLFFLIQAFPQYFVRGTIGIFVLQAVVLFAELGLIDGVCTLSHRGKGYSYSVKGLFLAMFSLVYSRGNMAEEYNLFLSLLGCYCVKNVFDKEIDRKKFSVLMLWGGYWQARLF